MKTSSAKAKARRVQNFVSGFFSLFGQLFLGLRDGDVTPRPMGQSGVDVIFSPKALEWFPFDIECKNVEKLNIVGTYNQHARQYEATNRYPLLIHSRNQSKTLVTLSFEHFLYLIFTYDVMRRVDWVEIQAILRKLEENKSSWEAIQHVMTHEDFLKPVEAPK
jgi:hypothetical protein